MGKMCGGGGITEILCGWEYVIHPIYCRYTYFQIISSGLLGWRWGGVGDEIRGRARMECVSERREGG